MCVYKHYQGKLAFNSAFLCRRRRRGTSWSTPSTIHPARWNRSHVCHFQFPEPEQEIVYRMEFSKDDTRLLSVPSSSADNLPHELQIHVSRRSIAARPPGPGRAELVGWLVHPLTLNLVGSASEWNPDYGHNVIFPAIEFIRSAWAIAHIIITEYNAATARQEAARLFRGEWGKRKRESVGGGSSSEMVGGWHYEPES